MIKKRSQMMMLFATLLSAVNNAIGFVSIDRRFCQSQNTTNTFMTESLQLNFPYIAFIGIPSWAKNGFTGCDCSNRGLNFVPLQAIPESTEYLDLSANHLRRISSKDFISLKNLVAINLEKNCLKSRIPTEKIPFCKNDLYIESGSFQHLQNLRLLLLTANFLKEFPAHLPSSLQYLAIDDTLLGNITASLTKYGSNIKGFSAESNCISDYRSRLHDSNCPRNFTITSTFSYSLEILQLPLNNWTNVPTYLMHNNLEIFDLSYNHVTHLRKNDFMNATNLKALKLSAVAYGVRPIIENGLFDPLTELEVLIFSVNDLNCIFPNLFRYNTQLRILDLSSNNLFKTIYNPTYLRNLRLLLYLDISANAFSGNGSVSQNELILGPSFTYLTSLHTLFVGFPASRSSYAFTAASIHFMCINGDTIDVLASMKQLTALSFSGISLKWLNSSALSKLKNLYWFDASNNDIRFLSDRSQYPTQDYTVHTRVKNHYVISTDIADTKYHFTKSSDTMYYKKLPRMILNMQENNDCTATNVLKLSNNTIESLKDNLKFLYQACMIDLSNNRINYIYNSDFKDYNNLQILILSNNPLHLIETYALSNLMNIEVLKINEVQLNDKINETLHFLYHIPNTTSLSLAWSDEKLQVTLALMWLHAPFEYVYDIDLSGNNIYYDVDIVTHLFQNAISLELRSCQIVDAMLQKPLLPTTNYLQYLDLGDNSLTQLPSHAIENLQFLETLALNHNSISRLSGSFLFNLTHLITFYISHNKISYIEPGFFSGSQLMNIDLSHNQIARLGNDVLTLEVLNGLGYLNFLGNEIDCSCGVWDTFYVWSVSAQSQQVVIEGYVPKCNSDLERFYGGCLACRSPFHLKEVSLLWYVSHPTCQVTLLSAYTISFISLFILFSLVGSLGYSQWIKRAVFRKVNQQFRVHSMNRELEQEKSDADQEGSVFVVFDFHNNEVADWVDYKLCQALTNSEPPLSVKIFGRDNPSGIASSKQALHNICNCKKTILILSYEFCLEKSCRFIISALEELRYSKGDDHLVLVAWSGENGSPRVPRDIQQTLNRKKQTFLRFDATDDDEEMFFETLKTALFDPTEIAGCSYK